MFVNLFRKLDGLKLLFRCKEPPEFDDFGLLDEFLPNDLPPKLNLCASLVPDPTVMTAAIESVVMIVLIRAEFIVIPLGPASRGGAEFADHLPAQAEARRKCFKQFEYFSARLLAGF